MQPENNEILPLDQAWQELVAQLQRDIKSASVTYIDSTLAEMGRFVTAHRSEITDALYEEIMGVLNNSVRQLWLDASYITEFPDKFKGGYHGRHEQGLLP